ncbi:crinkler family protein [Gigaspora margarita]|uniref:Crinkler family protein n=1 Tax=Gigaspora margarita TaxID=4874 RepID=A0A8H3X4M7_GIGMA|nr:crinkler family protein [Gigaspora margarita]
MSEVLIFCLILGDSIEKSFATDIDKRMTVGHLKYLIKKNTEPHYTNISANELELWKVDIPQSKENQEMKIPVGINIKEKLGGEKLASFEIIGNHFAESSINVRIIVQPPATSGKRKTEDSDENRSKKKEYPPESKEGRDSLFVISDERLNIIIEFVEKNRVGLLRSPPSSGKTTLGQTLRDYFIEHNHIGMYINLASIGGKGQVDEKFFEEFWKKEIGYTWTEISDSTKTTYVFIDEIQTIYCNRALYFWGKLKALMSSECNKDIHILLLGMYDPTLANEAIPVKFNDNDTLSLKTLLLTKKEFKFLVENYVQIRVFGGSSMFNIPEAIADAIFCLTNGHPGLCRFILDSLHTRYKNGALTVEMLRYLASSNLTNNVATDSRAFYWIDNWNPTSEEAGFIRNKLLINRDESSFSVNYESNLVAKNFVRTGLFAMDSGQIQFNAPIMRIVLCHRLFTYSGLKLCTTDFDEFLIRSIERMRPSKLSNSLGRGWSENCKTVQTGAKSDSRLFERSWQMEWYHSATSVVPMNTSISADVGPVFGSAGFLDFYVNGEICWGIELIREGDRLKEHAERFEKYGEYAEIPLKKWAIIDFRHHTKQVRELKSNFWYVLYTDNYKQVTIKRQGHKDVLLVLQGDNM